jgi:hypothetical protein
MTASPPVVELDRLRPVLRTVLRADGHDDLTVDRMHRAIMHGLVTGNVERGRRIVARAREFGAGK